MVRAVVKGSVGQSKMPTTIGYHKLLELMHTVSNTVPNTVPTLHNNNHMWVAKLCIEKRDNGHAVHATISTKHDKAHHFFPKLKKFLIALCRWRWRLEVE